MVKSRRRRSNVPSCRSCYPAKAPHFFTLIKSPKENRKLRIPRNFVRKYGRKLSNIVLLEVPNSSAMCPIWKVGLTYSEGCVWLKSGWKEFAEYYSISYGHLLVFRYNGNSNFHVFIFDMSASTNLGGQTKREETERVILGGSSGCQARRKKVSKRHVTMENAYFEKTHERRSKRNAVPVLDFSSEESSEGMSTSQGELQSQSPERAIAGCKVTALQRAQAFKSNNPFFLVIMRAPYVFCLHVPVGFSRKYFTREDTNVILRVANGRTWPAKCYSRTSSDLRSLGCNSFLRDNNVNLGDVCVFELIKETSIELLLDVKIFKAAK